MTPPATSTLTLSGPFKATRFFESLAAHLRSNVKLSGGGGRRSRVTVDGGAQYFTGTELVDAVYAYLTSSECNFRTQISRENAVKLASVLMDYHIFTPTGSSSGGGRRKASGSSRFEESKSCHYSFVEPSSADQLLSDGDDGGKIDADDVRQEVALAKLLTLIDIPVLDHLLEVDAGEKAPPATAPGVTCAVSGDDPVLHMLLSLCHSSGIHVPDEPGPHTATGKQYACQNLLNTYQEQPSHLVPRRMRQIYVEIKNILLRGREDTAVQALQMAQLILPTEQAWRLATLLSLAEVAGGEPALAATPRLLDQVSPAMFGCPASMQTRQAQLLGRFMVARRAEIGEVPVAVRLEMAVRRRIRDAWPSLSHHFCERVGEEEFERQRALCSDLAIKELAESVMGDHSKSHKEKREFLKKLEKAHPDIYEKYYSNTIR